DTGKSIHDVLPGKVLLNYNRAGIGLMEIVTEPHITQVPSSGKEAGAFLKRIRDLLRKIGVSNAQMEEGSLRCDVNVSVFSPSAMADPLSGTRCELKNMNSIKAVIAATDYEIQRQISILEQGCEFKQETRGYDAKRNKTFAIRSKEDAPDYRYMPEPDVPEIVISEGLVDEIRQDLPELPDELRGRLRR
ncbi:hypothetical protein EV182_007566, partial [Spiromyces aspiralis]